MNNVLDINYQVQPSDQTQWYPNFRPDESTSRCAYYFLDNSSQPVPGPMLINAVSKVTVSFKLELVRVKNDIEKNGGTVVLTINWGYWYTMTEVGILNND